MSGQLIPRGGGDPVLLPGVDITIGRDADCDVTLPFPGVSARHCRMVFRSDEWLIKDLGSKNGIRVNGKKYEKARLPPGCTLTIGGTRFEVVYGGTAGQSPQPESPGAARSSARAARQPPGAPGRPAEQSSTAASVVSGTAGAAGAAERPSAKPVKRFLGKLTPEGGGELIPLLMERLVVGRHRECDIHLAFSLVSGRHCEMNYRDGFWFVTDLDSRNGTRVNGQHVSTSVLMPGDILRIAKQRYEIDYKPEGDVPPPEDNPFEKSLLEKAGLQRTLEKDPNPQWLKSDQDPDPDNRIDLESL